MRKIKTLVVEYVLATYNQHGWAENKLNNDSKMLFRYRTYGNRIPTVYSFKEKSRYKLFFKLSNRFYWKFLSKQFQRDFCSNKYNPRFPLLDFNGSFLQ